jgi:hypothetical protein
MTCLPFLLLFHANNTLSITFKHETITPRILWCVSLFFQSYAWSYMFTRIFGISKFSTKTKIILVFVQINKFWKFKWFLRKVTLHLENLKKKTQQKKTMRWLQSWVLFKWIKNHFAYSYESKVIDPKCMHLKWGKTSFDNSFTMLKYILCRPL